MDIFLDSFEAWSAGAVGIRRKGRRISKKSLRGLTLIELLVGIIILSILAVILLPGIKKASLAANTVGCASNLKTWSAAINLYAGEHNGSLPPGQNLITNPDNPTGPLLSLNSNSRIPDWLGEYTGEPLQKLAPRIAQCPGDRSPRAQRLWNYLGYLSNPRYFIDYLDGRPRLYSNNPTGMSVLLGGASKKILLADAIDVTEAMALFGTLSGSNVSQELGTGGGLHEYLSYRTLLMSRRHAGKVNALFGDGSVRLMSYDEITDKDILRPDQF